MEEKTKEFKVAIDKCDKAQGDVQAKRVSFPFHVPSIFPFPHYINHLTFYS
jgi:hypothetical protein